ncbi:hypothetical protein [Empedobacter sp.]|uniref:hypothetical protein n=1 Tax=Empedobacter sp. TaxID=1927715 RepID=UPI0028AA4091|nr:hypothetical protein [Empedobacter sp.]
MKQKFYKYYIIDYFIIAGRFLLIFTYFNYGFSKLIDNQFGLSPTELTTPIQNLSLMKIGWFLFDIQPFKYFIGITQIISASLILFNRTCFLGCIILIPIIINIIIIDLSIMPLTLSFPFFFRLLLHLFLAFSIIFYYKQDFFNIIKIMFKKHAPKFRYNYWKLIFIPILALSLEAMIVLFSNLILKIINYVQN